MAIEQRQPPGRRSALALACVNVVTMLAFSATTCGEDQDAPHTETDVVRWATERRLGSAVDPARVVATVDDAQIRLADVALCLEQRPAYSPTSCLEHLIETALAIAQANDDDRADRRLDDARDSALAAAYLREEIQRRVTPATLDRAEIATFIEDPRSRLYFEVPELRRCAQLLVRVPENAPIEQREIARQLAQRIFDESDWTDVDTRSDLDRIRNQYVEDAEAAGLSLRVEEMTIQPYADPPRWGGIRAVVREFGEAVYEAEQLGVIPHPVETQFGAHIIVLQEVTPAQSLAAEEKRDLAARELTQRRRAQRFEALSRELLRSYETFWHQDNLTYVREEYDAALRERNRQIREAVRAP